MKIIMNKVTRERIVVHTTNCSARCPPLSIASANTKDHQQNNRHDCVQSKKKNIEHTFQHMN